MTPSESPHLDSGHDSPNYRVLSLSKLDIEHATDQRHKRTPTRRSGLKKGSSGPGDSPDEGGRDEPFPTPCVVFGRHHIL